jgi:hypothetical protein
MVPVNGSGYCRPDDDRLRRGTHDPWRDDIAQRSNTDVVQNTGDTAYGSPEFTEQVQHLLGCCGDGTTLKLIATLFFKADAMQRF